LITLRIQTVDAIIIKEIEHGEVKTQIIIGDKKHIQRKDIKHLSYKSEEELIETLKVLHGKLGNK